MTLHISSENRYSENPTLARHGSDSARIEINDIDTCWSLSRTTTITSPHLSFGHPVLWNVKRKLVSVLLLIFKHFWRVFTSIGDFFADFREPCQFSSPSPHRGMWATFWRSGADVAGYENCRGDPWWGRPIRCVAEGVEMTTPSAISISQPPN